MFTNTIRFIFDTDLNLHTHSSSVFQLFSDLILYVRMDGLYLPDGRQLSLIDRDWILDELPHLGNPDDNSDLNYLLASAAAANSGAGVAGGSAGRSASGVGATGGSSNGVPTQAGTTTHSVDPTGTGVGTGATHPGSAVHNHSLLYNPDEYEGDLTLLSEIIDETQSKWSDFGLNQLLTPFARPVRPIIK